MNILLMDGLPDRFEGIPISPDFRNMIQADMILHDPELSESMRTLLALQQLYPKIPCDMAQAVHGLLWFYSRGRLGLDKGTNEERGGERPHKRGYDFEQDADLIYSAFMSSYHIDLSDGEFLHWWAFLALFEGLPDDTLIKRVIYWRTADTTGMGKEERKHIAKMRKLYALKQPESAEKLSIAELERRTKERVAKRFAEAQKQLNN